MSERLERRDRLDRLERLDRLAAAPGFRLGVAALLACLHLAAFAKAGRDRLDLPFNAAPGEAPYHSDVFARATEGYPRQPHHWSRLIVSRWDAQQYIGFATRGLRGCPGDASAPDLAYLRCGLGWLPAYGVVGGAISSATGLAADVVLVALSVIAAIVFNFLWTSRTITARLGRLEAYAALLAFNVFPSAFYVVTPYTEAATLALVMGGFLCLANGRWLAAGALVGAASALRATAPAFSLGFACAAALAAWRGRADGAPRWWRPLAAIPLAGWGLAATGLALRVFVGDAAAFLRARAAFGDAFDASRLYAPKFYLGGFTAQHMDSVMMVGVLAIAALTGRELFARFRREEAVYLAVASVAVFGLATMGHVQQYWGINRYLLLCPFVFCGMGIMARRHTAVYVLWLALCAAMYWHVELCSYIAHGDPSVCPCLGRVEFTAPFGS